MKLDSSSHRLPLFLPPLFGGGGGARCGNVRVDKSRGRELPVDAPDGYTFVKGTKLRGDGNSAEE